MESLKAKHAKLDHDIQEESHRPLPDSVHLTQLKREKLRIKDEISRITR
ncbi:MAG: YdcH family protein [Pseudomonadota bacterium]